VVGFAVATGVIWGHFEEIVVLACLLASMRASCEGRHARAALWLGPGLVTKQWAVFALRWYWCISVLEPSCHAGGRGFESRRSRFSQLR
jgi:hypothetical protein